MRSLAVWTLSMVGIMAWAGCDRRPAPPPQAQTPPTQPASQPEELRPTTQELLSGPYKTIPLPGMPLAIKTPSSWKIDISGPVVFLEGPSPAGHTTIQLAQRDTLKPEQLDLFLTGVQKDRQQHPDTVKRADLRDLGKIKVLERLEVLRPVNSPKVDVQGNAILDSKGNIETITTVAMRWTLTAFVPYQSAFSRYELNFIDLTADQYAVDKDFLEKIINSLTYEPNAEALGGQAP